MFLPTRVQTAYIVGWSNDCCVCVCNNSSTFRIALLSRHSSAECSSYVSWSATYNLVTSIALTRTWNWCKPSHLANSLLLWLAHWLKKYALEVVAFSKPRKWPSMQMGIALHLRSPLLLLLDITLFRFILMATQPHLAHGSQCDVNHSVSARKYYRAVKAAMCKLHHVAEYDDSGSRNTAIQTQFLLWQQYARFKGKLLSA